MVPHPATNARKKSEMTEKDWIKALTMMLTVQQDGKLPHGSMKIFCAKLKVARSTLWRLWKRSPESRAAGRVLTVDCCSRKKILCGAKAKYNEDDVLFALK